MQNGVLYRYNPDIEEEEAQLVVPEHERSSILKLYHDDPTAGHYGAERTFRRIASRYFWLGMRAYVAQYIKACVECQKYKPSKLRPAGLILTTPMRQRFEVVAFDLFGPLPTSEANKNWIFVVEDVASRWIELFVLEAATAEACARILVDEICLRYGTPRRFTSDNGTQFVSAVMQQVTYCLGITHSFTPFYHPEANPVERKNRDLKTQLAIYVGEDHKGWPEKLPAIRFAMNTAYCQNTGYSSAYLTFGRELRTPDDAHKDLKATLVKENFVPEITPHLLRVAETLQRARETSDKRQDTQKENRDKTRNPAHQFEPGDHVLVNTHVISDSKKGRSSKLAPRRDGPYVILKKHGPTSYEVADVEAPTRSLGTYHTSLLRPFTGYTEALPRPLIPLRKRGRPRRRKTQC
jgi:transposase InsO family protein